MSGLSQVVLASWNRAALLRVLLYVLLRDGDISRERAEQLINEYLVKCLDATPVFSDSDISAHVDALLERVGIVAGAS